MLWIHRFHARWRERFFSLFFELCNKLFIAEFHEKERIFLSPPCTKRDESKAAVTGRKVAGPAVHKTIAEFNKIPVNRGATGESRTSGRRGKNSVRKAGECYKHREEKSGSVALRPVEIPPLYGAFPPHTRVQKTN